MRGGRCEDDQAALHRQSCEHEHHATPISHADVPELDVLHTHIPTPWSADISALVSLLKQKPLFVTYHNDLTGQGTSGLVACLYNVTFLHLVLWRAKKIVITQPKYIEHSSHLKLHKKKVITIPLGVTLPLTVPGVRHKADQIFFMSVLDKHHEYKGLSILLDAMVTVKHRRPEARLLVGGSRGIDRQI